jgi:AcrR family transcriptional regulator
MRSRRKIVDAAAALMSERGFAGTSISAVSQRSGLPSGSIYWHFASKEDLLAAVVEEGARRWFDALPGPNDLPASPAEAVEALLRAAARSLEERPEFVRLLLLIAMERSEVDEASLAVIRRARAVARDRLREMMATLLEPFGGRTSELAPRFAALALCVADGAFVAHHIDPDETDIRALFELFRRALTALARELLPPGGEPDERHAPPAPSRDRGRRGGRDEHLRK